MTFHSSDEKDVVRGLLFKQAPIISPGFNTGHHLYLAGPTCGDALYAQKQGIKVANIHAAERDAVAFAQAKKKFSRVFQGTALEMIRERGLEKKLDFCYYDSCLPPSDVLIEEFATLLTVGLKRNGGFALTFAGRRENDDSAGLTVKALGDRVLATTMLLKNKLPWYPRFYTSMYYCGQHYRGKKRYPKATPMITILGKADYRYAGPALKEAAKIVVSVNKTIITRTGKKLPKHLDRYLKTLER